MTLLLEFWHTSTKVDGFIAVKRKVGLLRAHMRCTAIRLYNYYTGSRNTMGVALQSGGSPAPSRAPPPLGRCLGGAWEVPGRCLGGAWEVPG